MNYVSIDELIKDLKESTNSIEDTEKIIAVSVLLNTVKEKLREIGGNQIDLFIPVESIMGGNFASNISELANSEITRLLFIYHLEKNNTPITLFEITSLKSDEITRDDIANENRVLKRLENKGLIDIDRVPENLEENVVKLNSSGRNYINDFIITENKIIDLYNKSRSTKIREFLLTFKENISN